jgi:hypothetical protein
MRGWLALPVRLGIKDLREIRVYPVIPEIKD